MSANPPLGGVVSIVVPTLNSDKFVDRCLASVLAQSYPRVELIVVDGHSSDDSVGRARAYTNNVFVYGPSQARGRKFGAPEQRNYGAAKATGSYVYYLDVDMILPPGLVGTCVTELEARKADAIIIPERSFGIGFWAEVKAIERGCYVGDDLVESPRFIRRTVWRALGGLDATIGGAGDDWDLHVRLKQNGFSVIRVTEEVLHNEGRLTLGRLMSKHYLYGKSVPQFVRRHGLAKSARHYNPLRKGYFVRSRTLARQPLHLLGLVLMRSLEYGAAAIGVVVGLRASHRASENG